MTITHDIPAQTTTKGAYSGSFKKLGFVQNSIIMRLNTKKNPNTNNIKHICLQEHLKPIRMS